ncbi:MAG TPA: AGE family epimerase/isomerase, partial [Gemmatales bacterium]|nr:AGE family epimerase/isomerase [Gemmatales bacterium]
MVRTLGLVLILGVFYLGFSVQTQQKREPDAEIARKLALRCRQLLDTSVVRFFLPACLNTEQGGYYETWKAGKFVSTGSQFVTQQARTLWFCSTLAREGINRECTLKAAHHGYTHLQKAFLDEKHGGYFSKVRDDDEPLDLRKHVYLQSFVLYGLSAYYRASNDATALQAAKALFTLLEKHAYDKAHGGYNEFFYRDWEFIRDTGEPIYVGPIGCKTYNTHLHILEAYTELYRIWPDALVKERLLELIHIITAKMRHRLHAFHLDQWQQDWQQIETPQNNRASYGHDLECTWLVQEAWRVLEIPVETQRAWIQEVVDYSLRFGYDEKHGGFFMG